MDTHLATIARLSQRIGELEGQVRSLEATVAFVRGDGVNTIDHAEWTLQTLLDRINEDVYINDTDDVTDYIVQALAALGSVTHGDAEADFDIEEML